jgi:hypothetical protein
MSSWHTAYLIKHRDDFTFHLYFKRLFPVTAVCSCALLPTTVLAFARSSFPLNQQEKEILKIRVDPLPEKTGMEVWIRQVAAVSTTERWKCASVFLRRRNQAHSKISFPCLFMPSRCLAQ